MKLRNGPHGEIDDLHTKHEHRTVSRPTSWHGKRINCLQNEQQLERLLPKLRFDDGTHHTRGTNEGVSKGTKERGKRSMC